MNFKKIEEAIEEKVTEIEASEGTDKANSYFALERRLNDFMWKCWSKGVHAYNENQP